MAQITPAALAAIYNAFNTRFQKVYKDQTIVYDQFADTMPSSTGQETYAWMGVLPKLRKWVGDRQVNNLAGRAQVLINDKFEGTIGVRRDNIEDDTIGVFSPKIEALGREAKKWPDVLVAAAVVAGTTTNAFDAQPFFYNAHPIDVDNAASATYQNRFDSSANGGGVGYPLNGDNVQKIYAAMMTYQGEDAQPLGIIPSHLMVPPQLMMAGRQICEMEFIAQAVASNVAAMQSNVLKGVLKLIVNPYLTDANRYYMMALNEGVKPFIFQLRNTPEFTAMDQMVNENVFNRDEFLYGVRARGAAGYSLPFLCASGSI